MNPILKSLADRVPEDCFSIHCMKENCKVVMGSCLRASGRLVDLDCPTLQQMLGVSKRCDFIYFGNADGKVLVVMIELKGGKCKPRDVCEQLQGVDRPLRPQSDDTSATSLRASRAVR